METLSIPSSPVYQRILQYSTTVTELLSGKEQRVSNWQTPRRAWQLAFEKGPVTLDTLVAFFRSQKGMLGVFKWMDPEGIERYVRFGNDVLKAAVSWGRYGRIDVLLSEAVPPPESHPTEMPVFGRASIASLEDGTLIGDGVPRLEDSPLPGFGKRLVVEEGTMNRIPYSDPTDLEQIPAKSNVTIAAAGGVSGNFSGGVVFADNSISRYAYFQPMLSPTTEYTISAYIRMEDGGEPVVGIRPDTGDFCLVIDGHYVTIPAQIRDLGDGLYRVSSQRLTADPVNLLNCGVAKYTSSSARTFQVSGFQVEEKPYATGYMATAGTADSRSDETVVFPTTALSMDGGFTLDADVWITSPAIRQKPGQHPAVFSIRAGNGGNGISLAHSDNSSDWRIETYSDEGNFKFAAIPDSFTPVGSMARFRVTVSRTAVRVYINNELRAAIPYPYLPTSLGVCSFGSDGTGNFLNATFDGLCVSRGAMTKPAPLGGPLVVQDQTVLYMPFDSGFSFNSLLGVAPAACYELGMQFSTTMTPESAGRQQAFANWETPRRQWNLEFSVDRLDLARLTSWFELRRGQHEAFDWVDPDGIIRRVRFAGDQLQSDVTWGGYAQVKTSLIEVI